MPLLLVACIAVGLFAVVKTILHLKRNENFKQDVARLEEAMSTWDEEKLAVERRQAVWELLNKYGRIKAFMLKLKEWQFDEAIFYELEDSYNTLRELSDQIENTSNYELRAELEKNRKEIYTSVRELIELG